MTEPVFDLHILHLEDDPRDASIVQDTLESEGIGCRVERADSEGGFSAALCRGDYDLILADYTLPDFDGLSALKIARKNRPDIPFIFVSGTLDEEVAIEALKIGATDYVFKSRLSRIVPSIHRALAEAKEKLDRKRAEEALRRSEAYLAEAQRLSHTGSFGWDVSTGRIYWSRETFRIFGYEPGATITVEDVLNRAHPEDRTLVRRQIAHLSEDGRDFDFEHRLMMTDGSVRYVRVVGHRAKEGESGCEFVGAITDITERKRADEALRQSEERFRTMADTLPVVMWITALDPEKILYVSPSFERIWGLSREELYENPGLSMEMMHPDDRGRITSVFTAWISGSNGGYYDVEYRIIQPTGHLRWIRERAVLCLDEGGKPYRVNSILSDVTDRKQAEDDLQQALEEIGKLKDQLYKENIALREEIDKTSMFEEIVGESQALQGVLKRVAKVATTDSTVLITGETGTGKELIARAIHKRSQRAAHAFVSINCAAVPASLIASELFGHEKGAFTGAMQRRPGRFELADGGTIFLDEIGELPHETQIALLRVLQEREFERVGGTRPIRADVRVIAATNRNLQRAINDGTFRHDLYYRLNVFPIEMPSLRERKEDIPLLVEYFIDRYASKAGKRIRRIDRRTLDRFISYPWPGNIRELQNVIERSTILSETEEFTIDESWLSRSDRPDQPEQTIRPFFKMTSAEEKETIEATLAETRGRVSGPSGAAARLGLPSSTLESKIKALKINKHRFHEKY
jgi:PAS domain S-box-containing protein